MWPLSKLQHQSVLNDSWIIHNSVVSPYVMKVTYMLLKVTLANTWICFRQDSSYWQGLSLNLMRSRILSLRFPFRSPSSLKDKMRNLLMVLVVYRWQGTQLDGEEVLPPSRALCISVPQIHTCVACRNQCQVSGNSQNLKHRHHDARARRRNELRLYKYKAMEKINQRNECAS